MNTDIAPFQPVYEYLNDEDLYAFAKINKIRGVKYIQRIIDYCSKKDIRLLDDESYDLKSICDITLAENIPLLAKHFRLKHFPSEVCANRDFVYLFVKSDARNIRYAHLRFLDDKEIMMLVAKEYPYIIRHVSSRLEDDEDFVRSVVYGSITHPQHTGCPHYDSLGDYAYQRFLLSFASKRLQSSITIEKSEELKETIKDCEENPTTCKLPPSFFCSKAYLRYLIDGNGMRFCVNCPLRDYYYTDEDILTEDKYVQMRKELEELRKELLESIELEKLQKQKEEDKLKKADDEYRRRNGMGDHETVYRINGRVCCQQEYLDDYYANCGHTQFYY